jgi:hypothetical protein
MIRNGVSGSNVPGLARVATWIMQFVGPGVERVADRGTGDMVAIPNTKIAFWTRKTAFALVTRVRQSRKLDTP